MQESDNDSVFGSLEWKQASPLYKLAHSSLWDIFTGWKVLGSNIWYFVCQAIIFLIFHIIFLLHFSLYIMVAVVMFLSRVSDQWGSEPVCCGQDARFIVEVGAEHYWEGYPLIFMVTWGAQKAWLLGEMTVGAPTCLWYPPHPLISARCCAKLELPFFSLVLPLSSLSLHLSFTPEVTQERNKRCVSWLPPSNQISSDGSV